MTKILRAGMAVAALALTTTPALAAPVGASTPGQASAKIFKPLTLTAKRNLDFGTIVVGTVAAGGETVSMNLSGTVVCGAGGLTCSGSPVSAQYNVQGTNNAVVRVFSGVTQLTNANDGTKLNFTPAIPTSVTLTSSGVPGDDFTVGGAITILPTTTDGVYSGTMNVTVDY
jgi:hypothetical protein